MHFRRLLVPATALLGLIAACDQQNPATQQLLGMKTEDGPLSMKSITPPAGSVNGDTVVLIRGAGFTPGMKVFFGDMQATDVRVVSEEMLTAGVPSQQEGTVDVQLEVDVDGLPHVVGFDGGFQYLLSPGGSTDTDSDGVTDAVEIAGWKIRVDYYGFGTSENEAQNLVTYTAISNPSNADTDGDGLSDSKEFIAKCDASIRDTDGDGLSDFEEVSRWHSSPVSVDTDADARGPDGDKSPLTSLFDGNELFAHNELIKTNWWERSGIKVGATSPTLADTDGDGGSDYEEFDGTARTAIFADLPKLRIDIVDKVDVRLDVEYAEEQGTTTAYETAFTSGTETSSESSTESSFENTIGSSSTTTESSSQSVTVGAEVSFPKPWPTFNVEATMSWEESLEVSSTEETTVGNSSSNTVGSAITAEESYSNYAEDSRALTEVAASGSMTMGVEIINEGDLSFKLSQLQFTVRQWEPNRDPATASNPGTYKTFATLAADIGDGRVLAPGGSSGVIQASASDVNADRVKAFLRRPSTMVIEPASYEIENGDGLNFKFIQENTFAQTAEVIIDYGPGRGADEYRIATNVDRNPDGTLAGIKLKNLMNEIVGVGNWESVSTNSDIPLTIQNNSFEQGSCAGTIPGWVTTASPQTACAGQNGAPVAPDGTRWAFLSVGTMQQRIGTFTGAPTYLVNFVQGANTTNGASTINVKLYAGSPSAGGTIVASAAYTLPAGSQPATRQATFTAGPAWNGRELWLQFEFGGGSANGLIDSVAAWARTSTPRVLTRVKTVTAGTNPRAIWAVLLGGQEVPGTAQSFDDIVLNAGDGLMLAYWVDNDRDGVWDAQERALGSVDSPVDLYNNNTWVATPDGVPDSLDTDRDGLADGSESRRQFGTAGTTFNGGWQVSVAGRAPYWAFSDPSKPDADGDTLTDPGENARGTDPTLYDTDGDGINDEADAAPLNPGTVLFVRGTAANDSGPGTTWNSAYQRLETAFARASTLNGNASTLDDVTQIWVAAGVYSSAGSWYDIPNNVEVLGGFSGVETATGQRNPDPFSNNTILLPGTGGRCAKATASVRGTTIDGFVLTGATQSALWISGGNLLVRNCFFYNNNRPSDSGGGAFVDVVSVNDRPRFENCIFSGNSAGVYGGAVYWLQAGSTGARPDAPGGFFDCEFSYNRCDRNSSYSFGGAVFVDSYGSSPAGSFVHINIERSRFERNTVGSNINLARGGALFVGTNTAVLVSDCEFSGNKSAHVATDGVIFSWSGAGGALAVEGNNSNCQVINTTFWGNSAPRFGGAVYVGPRQISTGIEPEAYFINCTFARNTATYQPGTGPGWWCNGGYYFFGYDPATNQLQAAGTSFGGAIGTQGRVVCDNSILWENTSSPGLASCPSGACNPDDFLTEKLVVTLEQQICAGPLTGRNAFCFFNVPIGSFALNHCCVFGEGRSEFPGDLGGRNNIGVNPLFVDSINGDLQLQEDSPCVDAGNRILDFSPLFIAGIQLAPRADIVGDRRLVDGDLDGREQIDMGAFELQR